MEAQPVTFNLSQLARPEWRLIILDTAFPQSTVPLRHELKRGPFRPILHGTVIQVLARSCPRLPCVVLGARLGPAKHGAANQSRR